MQTLSLRLTHSYVGTWQHLDKWEGLGSIDEIGSRELPLNEEQENDHCEPKGREVFCLVTSEAEDAKIICALHDTYTQWGCSHEYDCCGCRSYTAQDVKRVTGNLWRVEVWSSRNY
jgi:hypothetical protein